MGLFDNFNPSFLGTPEGLTALSIFDAASTPREIGSPSPISAGIKTYHQSMKDKMEQEYRKQQMEMQKGQFDISQQEHGLKLADLKRKAAQKAKFETEILPTLPPEMQKLYSITGEIPNELFKSQVVGEGGSLVNPGLGMLGGNSLSAPTSTPVTPSTQQPGVMFQGKPKPEARTSFEKEIDTYNNLPPGPLKDLYKKRVDMQTSHAPPVQVFNNTKDNFKNERYLRNDFQGLATTKAFNEVQSAYDQINVGIASKSPAGDLAAATKIMKILDPTSVVRESELGMAIAAAGIVDRIENYANKVISGEKLTEDQRTDFKQLAQKMYDAAYSRYSKTANEYRNVAREYNLNPDRIIKTSGEDSEKPVVKPSKIFDTLPPAQDFNGRRMRAPDGSIMKSNGMQWVKE